MGGHPGAMQNNLLTHLNRLLASHSVHYQQLRNFHWNVKGPMFFQLHDKFEELYTAAADQVDALAERIVALGGRPASTLAEHLGLSDLVEVGGVPSAEDMVGHLANQGKQLAHDLRAAVEVAERSGDRNSANLLDGMADAHDSNLWMLRAFLQEAPTPQPA